ncbi:MAG TPA: DNA methyltransferase [Terriglobales bacterium]|jgi:adenine-specific DNA-methyltransferase
MPRGRKKADAGAAKPIEQYEHMGKQRLNNPPAGLVTPETDAQQPRRTYAFDPHLDPQLLWAGKAEGTSFSVPTVSLHVHERVDPRTILEAVRRPPEGGGEEQPSLFESKPENPPLREAVEFYRHAHGWSNRLVAGDSLLVMNSLLEKEGMAGQVQMVYMDPPYGIRYGSNFQPFVNKRDVKDNKDEDLTQEPETVRAFRDTWELGIHSYLSYLRDRLLLARELLADTGSIFVQISDENLHHVREVMDEVFGAENFVAVINFKTMMPLESGEIESVFDYLCWYSRSKASLKYRNLFEPKRTGAGTEFQFADTADGGYRRLERTEIESFSPGGGNLVVFKRSNLSSSGYTPSCTFQIEFEGRSYDPRGGKSWRTTKAGVDRLKAAGRLFVLGSKLYFKVYIRDFGYRSLVNSWQDTIEFEAREYVVQTTPSVVLRCLLMTTDPGDIVLDPTCGSGTTAYVAEQWGRRWITCDTSRVAIALAKQRLMTASFDYYELARPEEGVGSGFRYKTVPHVTLKSIANNPEIKEGMTREQIDAAIAKYAEEETLYDQPHVDRKKVRVTGPFTVEAVPAPAVLPLHEIREEGVAGETAAADASVARGGATVRYNEWRDELLKTGFRGKQGQKIQFTRVEALPALRWLHADAETAGEKAQRAVISFGPEHGPLEARQVELAIEEARQLVPRPELVVFAAFQFDPEAAKDIAETKWPGVQLLAAQMNTDLLTGDLKKKRSNNESFWLIGQPDIAVTRLKDDGRFQVEVLGFDYFNTRTGAIDSGDTSKIAMWMLDTDYDGRSVYPRQVFFPMAGEKDGWARLARNLKAELDPELTEAYRGSRSLPFAAGKQKRVAVKIVDDRGIESLRVLGLE